MPDLVPESVTGFIGVNLRRDRLSISDGEVARAINADFHTVLGAAILRLGKRAQTAATLGNVVRGLAKINDRELRHRIVGRSVYRDDTLVGDTILSANLVTKM